MLLQPTDVNLTASLLRPDPTPTTFANISNAVEPTAPDPINLLNTTPSLVYVQHDPTAPGDPQPFTRDIKRIHDGNLTAPGLWLEWSMLNMVDSGWNGDLYLYIDGFRTLFSIEEMSFVEDPSVPSSWLRDVKLEVCSLELHNPLVDTFYIVF